MLLVMRVFEYLVLPHSLEWVKLKAALQRVLQSYPALGGRLDLSEAPAALTQLQNSFPASFAEWRGASKQDVIDASHWHGPSSWQGQSPPPFAHPINVSPDSQHLR